MLSIDFLAKALWPVLVAVPGFVAFFWQWGDRRERKLRRVPYIEIESAFNFGFKSENGFTPINFKVRNDADVPVAVIGLEVIEPKGCVMVGRPHLSHTSLLKPHWVTSAQSCAPQPGQWVVFVASTRQNMSNVQLVIRCTFKEMSATARTSSVKVNSKPITLTIAQPEMTK